MRRFLFWLSGNLPCRIITDDDNGGAPYLERYYLATIFGIRVYLHRFVGSDPDRGLHSHPWKWALSVILSGWYWEARFSGDTDDGDNIRKVRWLNLLIGESFHRVIMPRDYADRYWINEDRLTSEERAALPTQAWTLFIHREANDRRWGFLRPRQGVNGYTFDPFVYPGGGKRSGQWWKSVPRGKDEPCRWPQP